MTADCLRPKTDVEKLSLIIPLLALIALLVWWFTPHYTEEDEAYYRAVFCIIDHDDSRQFLHDMQNIVEGNSDYALHKTHYLPALGQRMLDTRRQLSLQEQQALRQDKQRCGEILREKQQGKSS
ncbi:hypothetical protein J4733_05325 [Klebsiella pneumoniae]|uniref:Uncharacterized protein n=1 Tax=Klebsiella pneumoniae TaxID=573 RepID=A0A939NNB6_KLEPN|nr:hypothetical protein [Klebsiella pneumoniae]